MTATEDVAERILPATFAAQADNCANPEDVFNAVRGRTRRQRSLQPALMVAVTVAAVVGISATVANGAGNQGLGVQQSAARSSPHRGLDQLSGTCLDMEKVKTLWGSQAAPYGGVGTGDKCSVEADAIQATHPEAASTIHTGDLKVYLAKAPAGIRAVFIALTPAQSAAAVKASGNSTAVVSPQFLIIAVPDDNSQEILLSILAQYQLPG